jgi:hypothetical protein
MKMLLKKLESAAVYLFKFVLYKFFEIMKPVPTCWVSLYKALDRLLKCWEAVKVYFLINFLHLIGDQEDGLSTELTVPECILYFVHSHLFVFQKYILVLERNEIDVSELHDILSEAFNQISQRQEECFYGMNVNLRLLKCDQSQKTKFMKQADLVTIAYLEKWTDFSD